MSASTRRHFLQSTTVGAVALSQLPALLRSAEPDRKIKLGLIGCGWYGMVDLKAAVKCGGIDVISLCDVDSDHLQQSANDVEKLQGKRPQTFKLYEDMLKAGGLDAVIIATPPHWHALQFLAALDHGLDVYQEKPLSYDIREGRAMVEAAKESGRIIQVGFQRRQSPAFQTVRQRVQAGDPGRIVCAEATINYSAGTKDPTPQPPPASLDWDLWCGPGPKIPYSPQVGHMNWRLEKTSGQGHLVDWGIHLIDAARVILGEGLPQTVSAAGGLYGLKGITTPDVFAAHFDFASCPLSWHHRIWGAEEYNPQISNGITLYGEKETIFVTDDRYEVIPRGKNKERHTYEAGADMGGLHMAEFLNAARTRQPAGCMIEDAYRSTAAVKLAMIAYDTGCKIAWDAQTETIPGNAEAARLLKRDYRAPWVHP
ncbi:MAG TPA: Gfo/Idh/MocA family oxidoreductase [Verrucomicrobiae bacterium]|nr:Gfo/Idh/MocA family oxidoreductase [Verrucomicrobiae bacterium]